MAMVIGSVTVDVTDGTRTGSGAALDLYDKILASNLGADIPGGAEGVPFKQNFALQANVFADWMVTYLAANVELQIGVGNTGLQRADVGGVPNTDTLGPSPAFQWAGII